ncbi:MAG TPA: glucose-6-phosphate isomerase [Anaerolineae bacterium]|nr:glucose-6-phosphate isomerase [Anaerolineae bacterium]
MKDIKVNGPADLATAIDETIAKMVEGNVTQRIWEKDHTVWAPEPAEISNRLGWLDIGERMVTEVAGIMAFVDEVEGAGMTDVVLLGMGGSSLAPEMFYTFFGGERLRVQVLDSTHPDAIAALEGSIDLEKTLFVVSSKSGGTVETLSFFKYFFTQMVRAVGEAEAGAHFVAITDPGSKLSRWAEELGFRKVFLNDPDIGGRYSALSFFGLVPAALGGADIGLLLERANREAASGGESIVDGDSPAVQLGVFLGTAARLGRDKLTLVTSAELASFGYWVEQLVAESTGKMGVGILPIEGEALRSVDAYGEDRIFVYLRLAGDTTYDEAIAELVEAGQPVIQSDWPDKYALGGAMWRWEMATAVAGYCLQINPFDQPNVESAKVQARKVVAQYTETGSLPSEEALVSEDGLTIYGEGKGSSVADALGSFWGQVKENDYVAIQAYLPMQKRNEQALMMLRETIGATHDVATTVGYGPRFLHSTGQLHKGDGGNGVFLVITNEPEAARDIPAEAGSEETEMPFGVLIAAQAMGDIGALREAERRVMRVHIEEDLLAGLAKITATL